MGTLHENQYTFLTISRSIFLRIGNVLDERWRENQTHIICSWRFFENHAVYEIMWKM